MARPHRIYLVPFNSQYNNSIRHRRPFHHRLWHIGYPHQITGKLQFNLKNKVKTNLSLWIEGSINGVLFINPIISHEIHRSSEDLSPNFVDRNVSIYDRSTRLSESSASDMYIRRPNNYHHNESRGRPRDRHYRNGSYSSTVDRCVYHFYPPLSLNELWFCFEI